MDEVRGVYGAVARGAAERHDLADVEHHRGAAHRVRVVAARSRVEVVAISRGIDPMHLGGRAGVEYAPIRHGKQPHVIVGPVLAFRIGTLERGGGNTRQDAPAFPSCPHLAGLAAERSAPRPSECEHRSVGQEGVRVVTARNVQVRISRPHIGDRVVDARRLAILASGDQHLAIRQVRRAWAKHVVLRLVGQALLDRARDRIEANFVGLAGSPEIELTGR
jgi:hypothetical protein